MRFVGNTAVGHVACTSPLRPGLRLSSLEAVGTSQRHGDHGSNNRVAGGRWPLARVLVLGGHTPPRPPGQPEYPRAAVVAPAEHRQRLAWTRRSWQVRASELHPESGRAQQPHCVETVLHHPERQAGEEPGSGVNGGWWTPEAARQRPPPPHSTAQHDPDSTLVHTPAVREFLGHGGRAVAPPGNTVLPHPVTEAAGPGAENLTPWGVRDGTRRMQEWPPLPRRHRSNEAFRDFRRSYPETRVTGWGWRQPGQDPLGTRNPQQHPRMPQPSRMLIGGAKGRPWASGTQNHSLLSFPLTGRWRP